MNDEQLLIQLRDCFTGGYTLPQFCIDNEIKNPLFVSEKKFLPFIWEIHVQFRYDKKISAKFSLLDSPTISINLSFNRTLTANLDCFNISELMHEHFDKIIVLTTKKVIGQNSSQIIYLDELAEYFRRKTYVEIPLLNFLQRNPRVKVFTTKLPNDIEKYDGGKEFGETLTESNLLASQILKNPGKIKTPLDKFGYNNREVFNMIYVARGVTTDSDGLTIMNDVDDPLIKIKNGKRLTPDQPLRFVNKIFFVGPCHYMGSYAPFYKTIESYLQKMLNEHNLPYRVENEGQPYSNRYQDIFYNLNTLNAQPGDIIFIWLSGNLTAEFLPIVDLRNAFDPPHDYREIFVDKAHINEIGYKILAEEFFGLLTQNNFFRHVNFNYPAPPPFNHRYGIPPQFEQVSSKNFFNAELEKYKKKIRAKKIPVGAIVMNCNPFTLGHQYLIKCAAAKVARLYIFVVEEDRSEFPFADRIELVKQGVKKFPNVEVLPSGKFIISQQTFSGYFNKEKLQDVQIDSSEDVEIFAKEIAPTLGITIRFAGEEPTDNVTRQYNETMKKILPRYGIEFCEIPRKNFSGEPISASTVREALKAGDFDKIKNLVPKTTFNYLRGRKIAK